MSIWKNRKRFVWLVAIAGWLALFVFYEFFYRNHLCHREQFSLFVWAAEPLRVYWTARAPVARLAGDMLTQFLSIDVVGPLIMASALTLLGVLTYRLLARAIGLWALLPAVAVVVLETGRQCGLTYPLSSTLQLVGVAGTLLLAVKIVEPLWRHPHSTRGSRDGEARTPHPGIGAVAARLLAALTVLAAGVWLCGWGDWEKRAVVKPEMNVEQMLAVDNDWYHGRDKRLQRRLDSMAATPSRFNAYYQNLLLTNEYRMGDELMHYYQPFQLGLFLPVNSKTSYPLIYMSGEMWFQVGDMTNAEHSTLLGMLFSPNSVGSRPLMRLAEINLINGDEAAAMKYLRVLDKTLLYHRWARRRMAGNRPKGLEHWMDMKRTLTATTDTVRAPMDISTSLRHLLNSNPDNVFARDYLLSYDLLDKNVEAFVADYDRYYPAQMAPQRVWSEALLIWLAAHGSSEQEVYSRNIPPAIVDEFLEYTDLYQKNAGGINTRRLQEKFGKTYWFFYHFAQINNGQ